LRSGGREYGERCAAADAFTHTQTGVMRDEASAVGDRLYHGERTVGLRLHDEFICPEPEAARRRREFVRTFDANHAGTRRAHRPLHEGRKIFHLREIVGRGDDDSLGLRRPGRLQCAKRGNLVLHTLEARERWHERRDAQTFLSRGKNRDLLLRRK
jgi:hypothetical protein